MRDNITEDIVQHILRTIPAPKTTNSLDKPIWMLEHSGRFTLRSAWEYIRQKKEKEDIFELMWEKSFLLECLFSYGELGNLGVQWMMSYNTPESI